MEEILGAPCVPGFEGILEGLLGTISEREAWVLRQRFGLDGLGRRTLKSIGEQMGVSGSRIRQIQVRGLRKLRDPARSRRLLPYLESPSCG